MAKTNNTIEINGKHYDAQTGKTVRSSSNDSHEKAVHENKTVPRTSVAKATSHPTSPVHKRPIVVIQRRTPEHTKTLMRSAVQKPKPTSKQLIRSQSTPSPLVSHQALITPKITADIIDDQRLKRAKIIPKSNLITHYNFNPPAHEVTRPMPTETPLITHQKAHLKATPRPQTTYELLNQAIEQATSHEQPPVTPRNSRHFTRRSKRIYSISGVVVFAVLIGGFILHHSMPGINLDIASSKAGFSASLPAIEPSGYTLSNLNAGTGEIDMLFQNSAQTKETYLLTEQPSNWDNDTLKEMYVSQVSSSYRVIEDGGRTVYLYGQQNATWVDGGIWYQLKSNGSLTDQQLIDIAKSL